LGTLTEGGVCKLAECFAHAIDKQYGPDAHLDVIHNGDGDEKPRC
jgi:hypothetical protein